MSTNISNENITELHNVITMFAMVLKKINYEKALVLGLVEEPKAEGEPEKIEKDKTLVEGEPVGRKFPPILGDCITLEKASRILDCSSTLLKKISRTGLITIYQKQKGMKTYIDVKEVEALKNAPLFAIRNRRHAN